MPSAGTTMALFVSSPLTLVIFADFPALTLMIALEADSAGPPCSNSAAPSSIVENGLISPPLETSSEIAIQSVEDSIRGTEESHDPPAHLRLSNQAPHDEIVIVDEGSARISSGCIDDSDNGIAYPQSYRGVRHQNVSVAHGLRPSPVHADCGIAVSVVSNHSPTFDITRVAEQTL